MEILILVAIIVLISLAIGFVFLWWCCDNCVGSSNETVVITDDGYPRESALTEVHYVDDVHTDEYVVEEVIVEEY